MKLTDVLTATPLENKHIADVLMCFKRSLPDATAEERHNMAARALAVTRHSEIIRHFRETNYPILDVLGAEFIA